jgi:hypothetical protein
MTQTCRFWGALVVFLVAAPTARAADHYVDPESGNLNGAGTPSDPWSTLEDAIASGAFEATVASGDRVLLGSGYHGVLELGEMSFDPPLVIEADEAADPRFSRVRIGASGVVVRGLSISPSHAEEYETTGIVEILDSATFVTLEDSEIFSEDDVSGWSEEDWIQRASSGVGVGGTDTTIANNRIRNVRFGISADGDRAHVVGNTIDGFSADGLRGLGDYQVFEYNLVKNVYVDGDVDENHDDGFQSWSVGDDGVGTGEVVGVVLRGNVILNYEDPAQPYRATLQGIGCFDGTFVDWVVENNVVITDHWHGITLLGAKNSRIVNNTVIDVNEESPGPPWISIDAHKDGTAPEGCLVRNNLATDFVNADTVTADHNFVIEDPFALFLDPANHDLRLLTDAAVIDQGTSESAPGIDADGIARPQGGGVDLGAFEWHEEGVEPVDAGVTAPSPDGTSDDDVAADDEVAADDDGVPDDGTADDDASDDDTTPSDDDAADDDPPTTDDDSAEDDDGADDDVTADDDEAPGADDDGAPDDDDPGDDDSDIAGPVEDAGAPAVYGENDGGCGCALPGRPTMNGAWLLPLAVFAALGCRRHRATSASKDRRMNLLEKASAGASQ